MSVFIVFPDQSDAGKVRFVNALAFHRSKVRRSFAGPRLQFLVEVEDRDAFAVACGTPGRPVPTDNAPRARPA